MEAEEEEIRVVVGRTKAALERYDAERVGGRTAEPTARHWATVRGTATSLDRRARPPPFLERARPKRVEEEEEDGEPRPRGTDRVVRDEGAGGVLRIQDLDDAATTGDGREASSSTDRVVV
ncbi:unnamed protein product [Urochloa humidicola]